MRLAVSKTLITIALSAAVWTPAICGQKKNPAPHEPAPAQTPAAKPPRANAPGGGKGGEMPAARPVPNPYNAVDHWNSINPKQRERLLSRMPPEKRQQFLEKIQKFNSLPKEEQQLARERY